MENHLDREEVQEAVTYGYGESEHYSATLLTRMIYTAERLEDDSIIRMSTVQYSLVSFLLMMLQPAAVMLLVTALMDGSLLILVLLGGIVASAAIWVKLPKRRRPAQR